MESNPFKHIIEPQKEVPDELKAQVMKDVATLKLLMDVSELFSKNYLEVLESFLKNKKTKSQS